MLRQQIRRMQTPRADEGFTLIELLIVIVVLGILAGIVVFGVAKFRTDSADAACNATMKTVQVAEEAYFAKNGGYTTLATLQTAPAYLKAFDNATNFTVTVSPATPTTTYSIAGTLTAGGTCTGGTLTN